MNHTILLTFVLNICLRAVLPTPAGHLAGRAAQWPGSTGSLPIFHTLPSTLQPAGHCHQRKLSALSQQQLSRDIERDVLQVEWLLCFSSSARAAAALAGWMRLCWVFTFKKIILHMATCITGR